MYVVACSIKAKAAETADAQLAFSARGQMTDRLTVKPE